MKKPGIIVAAAAALIISVVVAVIIYNQPTQWRPDQENWPPSQVWDPEDIPPDFTPPPPQQDVDWAAYRPTFKGEVDEAGDRGDCVALDKYFGEAANTQTADRLALTYIDKWGTHLNCPQFADSGEAKPGPPTPYGLCEPEGKKGKTAGGTKVICKKDGQGTLRWVRAATH